MNKYLYIMKVKIQTVLSYRFDVISTIFVQCITMFAICCFWMAVYGETDSAQGVSGKDMLTYTTISILMSNLLTMNVQHRILDSIRTGNVALDMLKPVNIYFLYLAEDLGEAAAAFFQKVLPLLLISSLMFGLPKAASSIHAILFLFSFIFSYFINWLLAAMLGLWAFKTFSMGPMMAVKTYIIKLLSGSMIPLWFFPDMLQRILEFLPFVNIYQVPLGIYIGKYSAWTALEHMSVQLFWDVLLLVAFALLQRKMAEQVLVQGG
ncbi:MAG: ABC-2 family transporter protein [Lachnospiraceae bacterium]|nr:ABC-2 family transporter protein [Lachnospiraceae bacterium]